MPKVVKKLCKFDKRHGEDNEDGFIGVVTGMPGRSNLQVSCFGIQIEPITCINRITIGKKRHGKSKRPGAVSRSKRSEVSVGMIVRGTFRDFGKIHDVHSAVTFEEALEMQSSGGISKDMTIYKSKRGEATTSQSTRDGDLDVCFEYGDGIIEEDETDEQCTDTESTSGSSQEE
jgi:hypothetical protein